MPMVGVFDAITPRMAEMLAMLLEAKHGPDLEEAFGLSRSAVRDELKKTMGICKVESRDELIRWWRRNRVPWALRLLERVDIQVEELVRLSSLSSGM